MLDVGKIIANSFEKKRNNLENLGLFQWTYKYLSHYVYRDFSEKFHKPLAQELESLRHVRGRHVNIIAPRGNAKTTWTVAKVLKAICEQSERYILIISDTSEQAEGILKSVRYELEDNELLKQTYGDLKGEVWNDGRLETSNDICIEALGTGKKVRGRKYKQYRPTLIILDDPQNDEDVESPSSRVKQWNWFIKALLPAGDTETNVVLVGTMLHKECIVAFAEKSPKFRTVKFKSVITFPERMDLWAQWEKIYLNSNSSLVGGVLVRDSSEADKFYETNREEMNAGAEVLWAAKESLYDLMKMRAEDRQAFNSEKQNDAFDPSKCEFLPEWFDDSRSEIWYSELPPSESIAYKVAFLDLAKGKETKKHDYTAFISLFYDITINKCYVKADLRKIPVTFAIDNVLEWDLNVGGYHLIGCEANAFQELVADELTNKCLEKHRDVTILPVIHTTNKVMRISRLGVWFTSGFFIFDRNCPYTRILIDQCIAFPNPKEHDDGPDALEGALALLSENIRVEQGDSVEFEEVSDFILD